MKLKMLKKLCLVYMDDGYKVEKQYLENFGKDVVLFGVYLYFFGREKF